MLVRITPSGIGYDRIVTDTRMEATDIAARVPAVSVVLGSNINGGSTSGRSDGFAQ